MREYETTDAMFCPRCGVQLYQFIKRSTPGGAIDEIVYAHSGVDDHFTKIRVKWSSHHKKMMHYIVLDDHTLPAEMHLKVAQTLLRNVE